MHPVIFLYMYTYSSLKMSEKEMVYYLQFRPILKKLLFQIVKKGKTIQMFVTLSGMSRNLTDKMTYILAATNVR